MRRPAGIDINPEVVRAMAVGWDYQARRKARFLEWLRSRNRTERPCSLGLLAVRRSPTPEAGVLACTSVQDGDGCHIWPGDYLGSELYVAVPRWPMEREEAEQVVVEALHVLVSPEWAAIFDGIEVHGG